MRSLPILAALLLPHAAFAVCGDAILDTTEDCDDGDVMPGDGCDAACLIEPFWSCETVVFDSLSLESWGGSALNWTFTADGRGATQSANADPGIVVTSTDATTTTLVIDVRVNTSSDDDYIGFVVGVEPGEDDGAADFLLIDWKQANQTTASVGLAVSRVTGAPATDDFWQHAGGVAELARGATLGGTGWGDNTTHRFEITYALDRLQVSVDGVPQIDITGTFPAGNLGFYNYSQPNVTYTLIEPTSASVCSLDDTDVDGVPDRDDNCPADENTSQDDLDLDGEGDVCDLCIGLSGTDTDADGTCDDWDLELDVSDIVARQPLTLAVTNAPADAELVIYYGYSGAGVDAGRCAVAANGTVCLDLFDPSRKIPGISQVDANGTFTLTATTPPNLWSDGQEIWMQAGVLDGPTGIAIPSNVVMRTVSVP